MARPLPCVHDSTASRQLSDVKHLPAQLVLRWVAGSPALRLAGSAAFELQWVRQSHVTFNSFGDGRLQQWQNYCHTFMTAPLPASLAMLSMCRPS